MVVQKYGILMSASIQTLSKQNLSFDCFCELATNFCSTLHFSESRHFNNFLCMPLKSSWYNNVQFVWYNKAKQEAYRPIVSIVTVVVLLCDWAFQHWHMNRIQPSACVFGLMSWPCYETNNISPFCRWKQPMMF